MSLTTIADPQLSSVVVIPGYRRLPVGARFPRTWPAGIVEPDRVVFRPERHRALVFTVGCRFPRRSTADVLAFLAAAVPTAPAAGRALMPPVGARFPRRQRPTLTQDATTTHAPSVLIAA
jgi:hypothetical protein